MASIPRFKLYLEQKEIAEIKADLNQAASHRRDQIDLFERKFSKYTGSPFSVFLPSARFGLYHILRHMALGEGAGVIVPAWTHSSVPAMVVAAGYKPMFVDIEPGTYNMSMRTIPKEYWKQAKAIIITHLYGCPAPVEELVEEAKKNKLKIIEDCAQSLGSTVHGRMTGSFGDAAIFSTSMTKNMTTLKGGLVTSKDRKIYEALQECRASAFESAEKLKKVLKKHETAINATKPFFFGTFVYPGLVVASNFKKDPIHDKFIEPIKIEKPDDKAPMPHPAQAAMGSRRLRTLDRYNSAKNENGKFILENIKGIKGVAIPIVTKGHFHIFSSFVMMVDNPWKVKRSLLVRGIDTAPGYLVNNAAQPEFSKYKAKCPMAIKMSRSQIHIPVYPGLERDTLIEIARSIVDICAK